MMMDMGAIGNRDGTLRGSIQEPGCGAVVAAGKRGDWNGGQGGWRGARLDAVITTAALDEAGKSAWCREHGVYPDELDKWRQNARTALATPEEVRASPQATRQDKKRIKELERELLRKDRALAEAAALLVLSKKVAAIFNKGEDE